MPHRITPGLVMAVLALSGCAGRVEEAIRPDELPVVCVAKPKPGNCTGSITGFYYDYRDDRCKAFYWSGCGGHVPYESMAECTKQCKGHN